DIYMWGGEPFCIAPTYELVKGLDELDFVKWMRIDTNLSYARKILNRCPSSKVRLNCSWHTERFDYSTVKKRITQLHKRNMVGMLNFVASDVNLAYLKSHNLDLDTIIRDFWDMGIYMNVAADFNKGNDREYFDFITQYMTVEDWKHIHGEYPSGQVRCDAGDHFFTIEHNGSLTSCGRVKQTLHGKKELEIVGNLFSGDLVKRQGFCPHNSCLSLVSYCHRMDNTFSCQQHLDDYVRRNIAHRIKTGLLSGAGAFEEPTVSQGTEPLTLIPQVISPATQKVRNELSAVSGLDTIKVFKEAQNQFECGNTVTAQRLNAQYKKTMDYEDLAVICHPSQKAARALSVVVVTYNRPDEVTKCVNFLRKQQCQDFEIIVVDNGDADKKAAALAGQVDVYVDCPMNFHLSEGRNIGAHFANGQILVFLDDDALVGPDYLGSIRKAFEQYEILGLRGRAFPKNGQKPDQQVGVYDLGEEPFATLCSQEGNSAFRRDAYVSVGGMDAVLFGHEGSDLSYRLIRQYNNPSAVIYWPGAVIYHDYGNQNTFDEKAARYSRNRDYLKYKYDIDVIGLKEEIANRRLRANQSGCLCPPLPAIQPITGAKRAPVVSITDSPKVSIVMSCHNAAEFLTETMDTILVQTLKEWELLVTDDGSTDATRQILETFAAKDQRIRLWFFDDQKGPYARRNFMIEHAKAPFICIQDSDDLMADNKLEILYEEINHDERLGIVGSFYRRFLDTFQGADFGDRMEKRITHDELMDAFRGCWHLCWHGSALIRKSLFETVGLYDEQPYGSDTFWLSKAGLYGLLTGQVRFKNLPEFLTHKREHAQSQTGKISPADPRSRRHQLERYYLQKLQQISDEARANPSMDVAQRIRECTCTDFIPKFGHLFGQWESAPVNDTMIQGLINRGLSQFSSEQYASALITLNCLDQMISGGCQSYRNLNLTRGLAYYAIGDDEQASANIQKEIQLFQSQNAQTFSARYLGVGHVTIGAADRRANLRRFIAEAAQDKTTGTSLIPQQNQLIGPSSDLQERLALAKQYLRRGKSEEALSMYQGLLSDNMMIGRIELRDKLKKLVEGIRLAKISQTSSQSGFDIAGSEK
ncbi:MAG: glycosyltransferase, partial [Planctomycetota bacterium]